MILVLNDLRPNTSLASQTGPEIERVYIARLALRESG